MFDTTTLVVSARSIRLSIARAGDVANLATHEVRNRYLSYDLSIWLELRVTRVLLQGHRSRLIFKIRAGAELFSSRGVRTLLRLIAGLGSKGRVANTGARRGKARI